MFLGTRQRQSLTLRLLGSWLKQVSSFLWRICSYDDSKIFDSNKFQVFFGECVLMMIVNI